VTRARCLRARAFAIACVVTTIAPATAWADDASAAVWKQRGDDAMDAGRAAEALDAYRRAAALEPTPSLEYNVGRALLAVGDFAGALAAFEHYEATAPDALKRRTHRLAEVLAELRAKVSVLDVHGEAPGARVLVDGKELGALPLAPVRTNPGHAELRVEREGYEPFVTHAELAPGATVRIQVVLRPVSTTARLAVSAIPRGAGVTVDGAFRGAAPLEVDVAPGAHRLTLTASGYEERVVSVDLGAQERRRIDVELTPRAAPITKRWWFWTALGVAAAGAAAGIVAASVERAPSEGTLGTFPAR